MPDYLDQLVDSVTARLDGSIKRGNSVVPMRVLNRLKRNIRIVIEELEKLKEEKR